VDQEADKIVVVVHFDEIPHLQNHEVAVVEVQNVVDVGFETVIDFEDHCLSDLI